MYRDAFRRYGSAAVFTMASLLVSLALRPLVEKASFDLFYCAVFLSAWYGGLGPGLFAALLSTLAIDITSAGSFPILRLQYTSATVNMLIFWAVAVITSTLSARLKQTTAQLVAARDELERRVRQRTEELVQTNERLIAEIAQREMMERQVLEISGREQRRLGQDLHDGLCQILAGVRLLMESLREKLELDARPEAKDAEAIETRLRIALTQADAVSRGLYPVELEENGLAAALLEMSRQLTRIYPVEARFTARSPILLHDATMATQFFRIAQEAAMNAIKSGKARRIDIRLFAWRGRILLVVLDDGIGFGTEEIREGMGLRIMRYRARMIRATFDIRRRRRRGTVVACGTNYAG